MFLIVELNASTNMFYLLKHILLLILVIFKLKCNDLIFNKILVLYASNMCLLHSHFVENHPIWILEDEPLISKLVLSQAPPHRASHRQPSVQSSSSSFALAHAEEGPRPRPLHPPHIVPLLLRR
jgi:hypothetical protein